MKADVPGRSIVGRGSAAALKIACMAAAVMLAVLSVWLPAGASTLGNVDFSNFAYTGGDYAGIDRAAKSVFYVEIYSSEYKAIGSGSGFVMFDEGLLVTNQHVIDGASYLLLVDDDGKQYVIDQVVISDDEHDIAILLFPEGKNYRPIPYDTDFDKLVRGQPVLAIGSPKGLPGTVSDGIISAFPKFKDEDIRRIQITAPISHGSSGGCLLNEDLKVIGVTSSGVEEGENLGFAIPVYIVEQLYRQWNKRDTVTLGTKSSWDTVGAGIHHKVSGSSQKPSMPGNSTGKTEPAQPKNSSNTVYIDLAPYSTRYGTKYGITVNGAKLEWRQSVESAVRFCNENGFPMSLEKVDLFSDELWGISSPEKRIVFCDSILVEAQFRIWWVNSLECTASIDIKDDADLDTIVQIAQEAYRKLTMRVGAPSGEIRAYTANDSLSAGTNDLAKAAEKMVQQDWRSITVEFNNLGLHIYNKWPWTGYIVSVNFTSW